MSIAYMNGFRRAGLWCVVAGFALGFAGCDNRLLDPAQIGRFRPTPAVNLILDSLGVAEETPVAWENAEEPRPEDIVATEGDYALGAGDIVRISIFELLQEGATMVNDYVVSESGKISIPEVGVIRAGGLTETQLEEEIRQILSPGILKEPSVTVTLLSSQQRTFSILGDGVAQPNRYVIPRYDFRLTDALATARGPMQFNVSYIYVSRREEPSAATPPDLETPMPPMEELELIEPQTSRSAPLSGSGGPEAGSFGNRAPAREIPEPTQRAEPFELEREMLDLIAPQARNDWPASEKLVAAAPAKTSNEDISATVLPRGFRLLNSGKGRRQQGPGWQDVVQSPIVLADDNRPADAPRPQDTTRESPRVEWVFRNGKWVAIPVEADPAEAAPAAPREAARPDTGEEIEWVLRDGQWGPVVKGEAAPERPPVDVEPRGPTLPLEEEKLPAELEWEEAIQTRLLRIPADKLLAGDPRYNIVIKPGDTIHVPVDVIGEFCIMGNVNRSGYFNITGRPMTLKMAIAAAGGLGPLAWPKYCEVVRRIGKKKEEIVMVDLDKIARGEAPDFFIKPNDLINVGTHPTSRWRAVLRNAFRATYGFGFVYDRNFAYTDDYYGTSFF